MTTASKITVVRILLIPVFIAFAIYYGESVRMDQPEPLWRKLAIATFIIAAASDALDGFIARRFNQISRLGTILDPIADKGLMVAALLTLSLGHWPSPLPLWFALLVISRDVFSICGALVIHHHAGQVHVEPHWTGKAATFFQIVSIAWAMLAIQFPPLLFPVAAATIFTLISFAIYLLAGLRQLHHDSPPA
jgi:CDP-diacylglycerol--glycerol-3-phosphate 3-phosphatidyltransferase